MPDPVPPTRGVEPEAQLEGDVAGQLGELEDQLEDQLEEAVLGEERRWTARELAAEHGVPIETAQRLWRALGFPQPPPTEAAFTRSDSDALGTAMALVGTGLVDLDLAVNLARGVGQTMARLSDWQVTALTNRADELEAAGGPHADPERAAELADELREPFEELVVYVWRRHLAAAAGRMAASRSDDDTHAQQSVQLCVGFADIVSFSALSNRLGEVRIGDVVELFEARCADVVATQRGRIIKSIGDSVLFVNDDPAAAVDTAEGIINVIGRDPRMPDVRVGLATGAVVMRLGDVFGPPVNLAARMTTVARRNRVIVDAATAALLSEEEFETRRLPARPVRGFGVIEPLTVRRH